MFWPYRGACLYDMHYIDSCMMALHSPRMAKPPLTGATVGERIAEARKNAGMNRKQFVARLGVGYMTAYDWERGKYRPRTDSLEAIAAVTGYSMADILGSDEPEMHPALAAFLATPFADGIAPDELERLRQYPWTGEPTPQTYHFLLLAIRAQLTPAEAAKAAKVTADAARRAEEKGLGREPSGKVATPKKPRK